jgi:hypothetical protein
MPTRNINQDEKEDQAKLEGLRMAIRAGEESGIAEGDVFEEVCSYIRIRQVTAEKANASLRPSRSNPVNRPFA